MALLACGVGGVLMGAWSPLSARAQAPKQLSPCVGGWTASWRGWVDVGGNNEEDMLVWEFEWISVVGGVDVCAAGRGNQCKQRSTTSSARSACQAHTLPAALIACCAHSLSLLLVSLLPTYHPPAEARYTTFLFYVVAVVLTMPLMSLLVQRFLGSPDRRVFRCGDYCRLLSCSQHVWGWVGGVAWAIGTVFNMISGNVLG
jgi:hypothetical protein